MQWRSELKIIACWLPILRKQCVNILFQLGVFFDIHRKSHSRKTLIFSTLSKQRYIIEYHFKILIIWRSQVQALSGPHWKSSTCEFSASAFSFVGDLQVTLLNQKWVVSTFWNQLLSQEYSWKGKGYQKLHINIVVYIFSILNNV